METKMQNLIDKASVLVEALPFIQKFRNSLVVIKCGGSIMEDPELVKSAMCDVVLLEAIGIRPIVVHGGGKAISAELKKQDIPVKFVNGLRYTDETTMDVVQSVLCGKVNKNLVAQINRLGGNAIGLCGMDGQLFQAVQMGEKYGLVGEITAVNTEPVETALLMSATPQKKRWTRVSKPSR